MVIVAGEINVRRHRNVKNRHDTLKGADLILVEKSEGFLIIAMTTD
jgi:hypothetical protein